jgi:copper transport protein
LRRWSTTAAIAVLALVVTGVWAAWLEVRSLGALHTTYGRLLITKTALLALMLILANVARVYVRQRASGRADAAEPQSDEAGWNEQLRQGSLPPREGFPSLTFSAFRNSVAAETSIAAVVLAITALLVQTQPAKDAYAPIYDVTVKKFGAFVQTTVQPARPGTNQLHVFLTDGTGRAREVPEIRASFEMPDRGIAPIRTYIHRVGPGHWEDLRTSLPQAGKWQLHLTIRTSDIDEYSYDQTISVR